MKKARRPFPFPPFRGIRTKATKWIRRFLPAEVIGTLVAIACMYAATHFTDNRVTIAYAASIAETIAFYLTIITTDALPVRKKLQVENRRLTLRGILLIFRDVMVDFGPAEIADSLVVRPLLMYLFPLWLGNYTLGIVAGKFVSDLAFYIPVIIVTEIRVYLARK